MLTHSYYEEDPRVRREAEALAAAGRAVDVFALRRPADPATEDDRRRRGPPPRRPAPPGRRARRLPGRVPGLLRCAPGSPLVRAHRAAPLRPGPGRTRCPTSWSSPTLPLRLVGVPVILDLHEAMPSLLREPLPFAARRPSRGAVLGLQERLATRFAERRHHGQRGARRPAARARRAGGEADDRPQRAVAGAVRPGGAARLARSWPTAGSCWSTPAASARSTSSTWCSTPIAILRARRPALAGRARAVRSRLRGGAAPRPGGAPRDRRPRSRFHGRIPIERGPGGDRGRRRRPRADPPRPSSPTTRSRPRPTSTPRWAGPVVASRLPLVERIVRRRRRDLRGRATRRTWRRRWRASSTTPRAGTPGSRAPTRGWPRCRGSGEARAYLDLVERTMRR